ncbi:MAG: energy-coupling factor ABC transporter permease, partial [Candidatus Contendobacter sp.]|nr:energy-coupling factor ABC transporter permease [Candidatus Contendobacter sp.]
MHRRVSPMLAASSATSRGIDDAGTMFLGYAEIYLIRKRNYLMHIPQNLLDGSICPVTAAVSGLCLAGAALAAYRSAEKPHALRFAAVSAFLFAAQMMNFPI